jgi:molybdopterin-binding protein
MLRRPGGAVLSSQKTGVGGGIDSRIHECGRSQAAEHSQSVEGHGEERDAGSGDGGVVVDVDGKDVTAEITRGSAENLLLAEGNDVVVLIKSIDVMIGK